MLNASQELVRAIAADRIREADRYRRAQQMKALRADREDGNEKSALRWSRVLRRIALGAKQ